MNDDDDDDDVPFPLSHLHSPILPVHSLPFRNFSFLLPAPGILKTNYSDHNGGFNLPIQLYVRQSLISVTIHHQCNNYGE